MILSVDCGLRECGWATWAHGRLWAAGLARNTAVGRGPQAWLEMANAVRKVVSCAELLLIETQQLRHTDTPAKVAAILELQGVAGALAGAFRADLSGVRGYLPHEWKGSIDGDAMVERIKGRLSPAEMARVGLPPQKSLQHNVWDAIGIGAFYFGRLEKKRVIAR